MRARYSYARLLLPLAAGGLVAALLLPGGDPSTTTVAAVSPVHVNSPNAEPIAVARVGKALLAPIPLTELSPEIVSTPAVPESSAVEQIPQAVETTASIPDPPPAMTKAGEPSVVGARAVNLRVGPSKGTASVAVLQPGEPVKILEASEGWTYVATLSGDTGWVSSGFLGNASPVAEPTSARRESSDDGKVIRASGPITVRSGPSSMSERLFVIEPGEQMRIAETRGNWARVVLDGGSSGWVRVRRAD